VHDAGSPCRAAVAIALVVILLAAIGCRDGQRSPPTTMSWRIGAMAADRHSGIFACEVLVGTSTRHLSVGEVQSGCVSAAAVGLPGGGWRYSQIGPPAVAARGVLAGMVLTEVVGD